MDTETGLDLGASDAAVVQTNLQMWQILHTQGRKLILSIINQLQSN